MYHLTKRQVSILYYILESKENISIKKLAARYQLSERSIHYDLDYINAWLKERSGALKKSKSNGICFDGMREIRDRILSELLMLDVKSRVLQKSERIDYIYMRLLLTDSVVTSEEIVRELMVSRPTVLSDMKEVELKLRENSLILMSKKGTGYWISGKETLLRPAITQTLLKILITNRIQNYDSLYMELSGTGDEMGSDFKMACSYICSIDIEPIYSMLNILRKENGILISDADSFDLFVSIVVMVSRLLKEHTVQKEDITSIRRNEETKRYVLARSICEQLEDDYDINCSRYEIIWMVLKLIASNVNFTRKEQEYQKEELSSTVDLMLQVLHDYEAVHINNSQMQDLKDDLYEYLSLLLRKKELKIRTPNPLLVQTKAGYPQVFEESVKMAGIFKLREGVELTEEEIGTIAIHVAAYSDTNEDYSLKTALIVCNEGKGLSKILYNRVKNNIPNVHIQNIVSVNQFLQAPDMAHPVDFIISTADLPGAGKPVFCVSPIVSVFDLRLIGDYVAGHTTIEVVDNSRQQETYLQKAIMGLLGKYLEAAQIRMFRDELDYILNASTGVVTEENTQLIQEDYAYKTATVIVKLAEMFQAIKERTSIVVDKDTMMGLAIHVSLSVARWEKKDFLPKRSQTPMQENEEILFYIIETFLDEVSSILSYQIPKGEADAIMRYLI